MRHLLTLALAASLGGCCLLDHDQLAGTAARRVEALSAVEALPDSELTPAFARELARDQAHAWAVTRARLLGEPAPRSQEAGQ